MSRSGKARDRSLLRLDALFFATLIGLIVSRLPALLLWPRFWAEEGTQHFQNAYLHGFWRGIFSLPNGDAGYYSLAPNLATALASLVPLGLAPVVTTYYCVFYMVVLLALLLWAPSVLLDTRPKRYFACLIVLLAPTAIEGVWLNSISLQVYCGIASVCLLFANVSSIRRPTKIAYRCLLVHNVLTGLYTVALVVPFLMRFLWKKEREARVQFLLVLAGTILQLLVFLSLRNEGAIVPEKAGSFAVHRALVYTVRFHIVGPILGEETSNRLLEAVGVKPSDLASLTEASSQVLVAFASAATLGLVLFGIVFRRRRDFRNTLLIVSFLGVAFLTTYGAVDAMPRDRYAVVPGAIFLFLVLNNLFPADPGSNRSRVERLHPAPLHRAVLALVLFVSLGFGVLRYWDMRWDYRNAPYWVSEIERWRREPQYVVSIFPYPQWRLPFSSEKPDSRVFATDRVCEAEDGDHDRTYDLVLGDDVPDTSHSYLVASRVDFRFDVVREGTYRFEARVLPADDGRDSLGVRLDGDRARQWPLEPHESRWVWRRFPSDWRLSPGIHTVRVFRTEPTFLDQVRLVRLSEEVSR